MHCWPAYTSLLRITTALPSKEAKADDAREVNPQANDNDNSGNTSSTMSRITSMVTRPLFARGTSRSRAEPLTPSELERGNGAST
jgi:hypothetical protein